jgi:hypothetical protein
MNLKVALLAVLLFLSACASSPSFSVDEQVWVGQATKTDIPDTYVKITFSQSGENVEAVLEIGPSADRLEPPQTLLGTLKDTSLSVTTATNGDAVTGTFNPDNDSFSGTLTLLIDDTKDNFVLTMTRQQGETSP